ncbi:MAG: beta-ketoacyl-[acyl-carrier-protein] synthase family protein [Candidatus Omnitrophota bacterium]
MSEICITGLGVVAPSGIGRRQFWANVRAGRSFIKPITRFDASKYHSRIAGQIDDIDKYSHLSERLLKKMDTFSHLALIAAELAMQDAGIDIGKEDPNAVGIFLGNALGGWLYAETELRDLYLEGREGVSPYMASAWFPAAPQGQVSIYYGIKGFSKTIVADRASSLQAIGYAAKTLSKGRLEMILAGGMEAPVTPYALLCCSTYGCLSTDNDNPAASYRPFDRRRRGFVIGEGAGIVTLERSSRARERGAKILGVISGYGSTSDGANRIDPEKGGRQLSRAIRLALCQSRRESKDIDLVILDGLAVDIWDRSEVCALRDVFGAGLRDVPLTCPKPMFGNLLGASGALDLIVAILSIQNRLIPPTINIDDPEFHDLNFVCGKVREAKINNVLIISRGRGGINTAMVVSGPQ